MSVLSSCPEAGPCVDCGARAQTALCGVPSCHHESRTLTWSCLETPSAKTGRRHSANLACSPVSEEIFLANNAEPQTITGCLSSYSMWGWGSGAVERGVDSPRVDQNTLLVEGGLCTASLAKPCLPPEKLSQGEAPAGHNITPTLSAYPMPSPELTALCHLSHKRPQQPW